LMDPKLHVWCVDDFSFDRDAFGISVFSSIREIPLPIYITDQGYSETVCSNCFVRWSPRCGHWLCVGKRRPFCH
jgi:hypothetical protein